MPVGEGGCAPFTDGRWLFSHNGRVERLAGLAGLAGVRPPGYGPDHPRRPDRCRAVVGARPPPPQVGQSHLPTPWPRWSSEVASARARLPAQPPAHRRQLVVGTTWTHALWTRRSAERGRRQPPSRGTPTDPRLGGGPRPPPGGGHHRTCVTTQRTQRQRMAMTEASSRRLPHRRGRREGAAPRRADGSDVDTASGCRPSGSTTPAAASCSRTSPGSRTTTPPGRSARSSTATPATSPHAPGPTRWSSWAQAPRRRRACCSTRCAIGGTLRHFVPLDVSETALREAVDAIARDYPGIAVHGVVGDFTEHLGRTPGGVPRLVAFLGGTIGNLFPHERATFLGGGPRVAGARGVAAARHRPGQGPRRARPRLRRPVRA